MVMSVGFEKSEFERFMASTSEMQVAVNYFERRN
jgi:hypothetical protein